MINKLSPTRYLTYMSMLLAMIVVLSIFEGMLPPLPYLPPGVKIGISNIVTMYTLFCMDTRSALTLAAVKSLFVGITRGVTAGILSICGGLLSISVLLILLYLFKDKLSYIFLSILGAIAHNIGQLMAITIILNSIYTLYYLPILLIAGIIMGTITGTLLKVVMPVLSRLS